MKKTIVINWRWTSNSNEKNKKLEISDDKEVIFCWYSDDEIAKLKLCINEILSDKKLVLLHRGNDILPDHITDLNVFTKDFGDAIGAVYYHNGGLVGTGDKYRDIEESFNEIWCDQESNLKRFNKIWESYFVKEPLIDQKKKLINLWLPFAIDIQGLSEITDKEKRTSYFQKIRADVQNYGETFHNEWEKIKDSFDKPEIPNQILSRLNNRKDISVEEFYNEFVKKENDKFLPNWLQKNVTALDKKINSEESNK